MTQEQGEARRPVGSITLDRRSALGVGGIIAAFFGAAGNVNASGLNFGSADEKVLSNHNVKLRFDVGDPDSDAGDENFSVSGSFSTLSEPKRTVVVGNSTIELPDGSMGTFDLERKQGTITAKGTKVVISEGADSYQVSVDGKSMTLDDYYAEAASQNTGGAFDTIGGTAATVAVSAAVCIALSEV